MYTEINFKTKKALKAAVEHWNVQEAMIGQPVMTIGALLANKALASPALPVQFFQPGPFSKGDEYKFTGTVYLEGPHYPEPHRWYAQCQAVNGIIVKVK